MGRGIGISQRMGNSGWGGGSEYHSGWGTADGEGDRNITADGEQRMGRGIGISQRMGNSGWGGGSEYHSGWGTADGEGDRNTTADGEQRMGRGTGISQRMGNSGWGGGSEYHSGWGTADGEGDRNITADGEQRMGNSGWCYTRQLRWTPAHHSRARALVDGGASSPLVAALAGSVNRLEQIHWNNLRPAVLAIRHSASAVLYPLFCIRCSASAILHPLFCIRCSASAVLHLLFCIRCFASAVLHLLFCICCSASAVLHPLFCIRCGISGFRHPHESGSFLVSARSGHLTHDRVSCLDFSQPRTCPNGVRESGSRFTLYYHRACLHPNLCYNRAVSASHTSHIQPEVDRSWPCPFPAWCSSSFIRSTVCAIPPMACAFRLRIA
jgi:hypothetical protein